MKFEIGQSVTYVPNHAKDRNDSVCRSGIVSSVENLPDGSQKVWVRYSHGSTGALTPTKNLVPKRLLGETGAYLMSSLFNPFKNKT